MEQGEDTLVECAAVSGLWLGVHSQGNMKGKVLDGEKKVVLNEVWCLIRMICHQEFHCMGGKAPCADSNVCTVTNTTWMMGSGDSSVVRAPDS